MIQHILKIIWAERKINLWILFELILVFSILWFCSDYLAFMFKKAIQSNSYDIENTYIVKIGLKPVVKDADNKQQLNDLWTIYNRVKQNPAVETACFSFVAIPYSGAWFGNIYTVDTIKQPLQRKWVTPEFFDVYKIDIVSGTGFNANNILQPNNVIISAGEDNLFAQGPINQVTTITTDNGNDTLNVLGVAARSKRSEYNEYNAVAYIPLTKDTEGVPGFNMLDLSVRIKPNADKDFMNSFFKDMQTQCQVGPFYLSSISSGAKIKEHYLKFTGITNAFRSIAAITSFLILNIFLGVIGTFWFRIQTRRSEVGLRIAMGASKVNVKTMFVIETIILLFLASIVASIICINLGLTDLLRELGLPMIREQKNGIIEYITNYAITFGALAIISILAVWYPAHRASQVFPSEALRDE